MSLKTLLIANRGEIAIRIARAAAGLGIRTVAIHAQDDSLFKGGQIKERMTGFQPKEKLSAKVTPHV